ncbi:SIS domain-containing protein [Massilia sp. 9I]|uniref:SIS domain-containing protein n=1 Tax=Massilia sp. 9I TaxID=2653152 RepID=UPI0012F46BE5|nr:SIS domain-containing protein [Massilia sp. 9I]VXC68610.1 tagatose-6-phosphate ketose/aldose isomerase [Massilia sp. 9I]
MTTLLQRSQQAWSDIGGLHTAEEIVHQPALWGELSTRLQDGRERVAAFLEGCLANPLQRVILTGAGSSAYVGEIIADELNAAWPAQVRAIATTTLLTHPELYIETGAPTLLVSFARSGDSPESLAVVELVRELLPDARLLNITCNPEGRLARDSAGDRKAFNLLMPAASCDRGFAMTSSFTCMLLAALAVLGKEDQVDRIATLARLAEPAMTAWEAPVAALAASEAGRVVYLGSGPLEGLAKESALKLLELTAGRVPAMANTPLGFRHGPKSVLNADALVFVFGSAKKLAQRYEADLVDELRRDGVAGRILTIGPGGDIGIEVPNWSDAWLAPLWLLVAQQVALHQSAALQLRPDNPFASGTVNRVVKGVTIYRHDEH